MNNNTEAKRPLVHWIFFWAVGAGNLFVWNSILSMTGYWKVRYNLSADSFYPFFYNFGSFSAFLVFDQIKKKLSLKQVMLATPPLLVLMFVALFIMGEFFSPEGGSAVKYWISLIIMVLIGLCNNIMQTYSMQYTFGFTSTEISYLNSGGALVGILCNIISLICFSSFAPTDFKMNGLVYLIFQIVFLLLILFAFWRYFAYAATPESKPKKPEPIQNKDDGNAELEPNADEHQTPGGSRPRKVGDQNGNLNSERKYLQGEPKTTNGTTAIRAVTIVARPPPPMMQTLRMIAGYFSSLALLYAITLSVFPAVCFSMGLGWKSGAFYSIILLEYNISDLLGRYIYPKLPLGAGSWQFIFGTFRIVLVVFAIVIFGGVDNSQILDLWYVTTIFTMLLGGTNGYLTSCYFANASESVPTAHKNNSGFLMTLALFIGLTYGSLTILLGTSN